MRVDVKVWGIGMTVGGRGLIKRLRRSRRRAKLLPSHILFVPLKTSGTSNNTHRWPLSRGVFDGILQTGMDAQFTQRKRRWRVATV